MDECLVELEQRRRLETHGQLRDAMRAHKERGYSEHEAIDRGEIRPAPSAPIAVGWSKTMRGTWLAEPSAFVEVAEQASFTKAVTRLGVSTGRDVLEAVNKRRRKTHRRGRFS